jgi:hypothetical protein
MMETTRRHRRKWLGGLGAVALAFVAFATTYALRGADRASQATTGPATPDHTATPAPHTTPDTSQPFWYQPFLNQDAQRKPFRGTLNGLEIDTSWQGRTALDVCPPRGLDSPPPRTEISVAAAPGPLQVDPKAMPQGVSPSNVPDVFLCHGELALLSWTFSVSAGTPDVNEGGSSLLIHRFRGREPITYGSPRERWSEATVNGLPVVMSRPIVTVGSKQFGGCFVAGYNSETDVTTEVSGTAANEGFCLQVAQAVMK